ncbi:AAA family ATPase [Acetobacterium paludosum]|uniref:DNA 3'-5' helicase n=1 Tax=Acetobacterium paludosum TaxID=52693 RepID=A0A923KS53_9FIRM|nr:ATP-dependent helicase [Acetobacterium paludosum]MBC3887992.1 AAA family ATPase [Acetobacterium paludosum]
MKNYEEFKKSYQFQLNEQQEKAVIRTKGQSLLLAVPGSGKTTVIICRIAYLLMVEKIDPGEILTLTFSRMGARDLKQRYQNMFSKNQAESLQFSTIHSFALSVIRQYERSYRRQAYTVLGNTSPVIKDLYRELFQAFPGEIELGEISQRIGFCKNMLLTTKEIKLLPPMEIDFIKIYEAYEAYKLTAHLMDFDDILKYAWGLLKKYPELLNFFQKKYNYIHLDEAQDTSKIQFKIIELLAGKNGNLFMVGDEDQSIYGFRGAFPESLLSFKETWPQGEVLLMETNYRSTRQIVEKANAFIKLNHERYKKEMDTPNGVGIPIIREWVKSSEDQYKLIIESIKHEGKETAVLYRNNESAIPLVDLLDGEKIPYQIKEHSPQFFTHFMIKDIQLFYQFACYPTDPDLFAQMYYKMDAAISKETVAQLKNHLGLNQNVFDALINLSRKRPWQIERFKELKDGFQRLKTANPQNGIQMILDDLGYRSYLNFRISSGQSEENIEQKLSVLKILGGRVANFKDFFTKLDLLEEKLKEPQTQNDKKPRVTLSTLHSSKGLEFEKVFIIDATEGQLPSVSSAPEDEKQYAEEVRLFYVGATRAKKELIFLCVKSKQNGIKPSPFIAYIIDGLPKKKPHSGKPVAGSKNQSPQSVFNPSIKWQDYTGTQEENADMDLSAYQKDTIVTHQRFGKGTIVEKNGAFATIQFEKAGEKKMNLVICITNGVIK